MLEKIDLLAIAHPWLLSLAFLVLGALLGSQLNYWRGLMLARRTEFNNVADPLRAGLLAERRSIKVGHSRPDADKLDLLGCIMSKQYRKGYNAARAKYQQARKECVMQEPEYGSLSYSETAHIEAAIDGLLRYMVRR